MGIAFKRKTSSNEAPPPADARSKPRNGRGKKNLLSSEEEALEGFEDEGEWLTTLLAAFNINELYCCKRMLLLCAESHEILMWVSKKTPIQTIFLCHNARLYSLL